MTSQQLTTALRVAVAAVLIALLGVTSIFGYTVYRDRQEAIQSTPALRTIQGLEKLVRSKPNNVAYRVRLGEGYAAASKYQDAIEQFNNALKIDPKHVGAYLDLGMVAMITKHEGEAKNYFEKVVALTDSESMRYSDGRRENALYNLGNMALGKNDYEEAIGYFKEALRIRKDSSDTYLLLSRAFLGLDELDEAIKYVEYALAFDPNYAQANYQAGELYLKKKDFLKASEHIRRAVDNAPDQRDPQLLLKKLGTAESWAEKARGQMSDKPLVALDSIKVARRIDPESADLAVLHAQVLEKLGKNKEALVTYREAAKLDPADATIPAAVARLEAAQKKKSN